MREEIGELLKKDPFRPFRITLTSGQFYDVRFPGLATLAKDVFYFYHPRSELHSIIRLVQIAAIDIID